MFAQVAVRTLRVYQAADNLKTLKTMRWLVVFSQAAYEQELQTLTRAEGKELQTAQKQWHKLCLQTFNCQADAQTAADQFNQCWKLHQAHAEVVPIMQYARRGRPAAEDQEERFEFTWEIGLTLQQFGRRGLKTPRAKKSPFSLFLGAECGPIPCSCIFFERNPSIRVERRKDYAA